MNRIILSIGVSMLAVAAMGQTSREEIFADLDKAGGVYYAYPATSADNTPAPKGYAPFYISHFGRHGSRYLISDDDYNRVAGLLERAREADALTPLGKELAADLDSLLIEARGRGGDLSPLGVRQHKAIARRMAENYPEVFKDSAKVDARSTLVVRCVLSMAAFCESLKEINPSLDITRESSQRYMPDICPWNSKGSDFRSDKGWWKEVSRKFKNRQTRPDRLVKAIFSDDEFVDKYVNPYNFMWGIYWLAADGQNTEGKIDFKRYLTPDEMFDLWQCFNADFYARYADFPGNNGVAVKETVPILKDIVDRADVALAADKPSASLRFAHDGNLVPFSSLLGIPVASGREDKVENFYKAWCDFNVSPMAGNIQFVFFKNKKNPKDIIVKVLHNEKEVLLPVKTDIAPYCRWDDMRDYLVGLMKE